jgi:cytochrome c2
MKTMMAVAAIALAVLIGAVGTTLSDNTLDQGMDVYATQKCALCHSISGIGGKKLPLDGVGSRLSAETMRKWIKTPKAVKSDTTMKAYPKLPEKDLADLTAYLLTLK